MWMGNENWFIDFLFDFILKAYIRNINVVWVHGVLKRKLEV